jgi:hypothetical protein
MTRLRRLVSKEEFFWQPCQERRIIMPLKTPGRKRKRRSSMEAEVNRRAAAYLVSAALCSGLLAASHAPAQAGDGRYVYTDYPDGSFCLTYPTYPMQVPPNIYWSDYGCPPRNVAHLNLRGPRLAYPGALGAYDNYYYDLTDPLDHVTSPLFILTVPIKALSTPAPEAETITAGQIGHICSTPAKTCELKHPAFAGSGCSCRVPGGQVQGSVMP